MGSIYIIIRDLGVIKVPREGIKQAYVPRQNTATTDEPETTKALTTPASNVTTSNASDKDAESDANETNDTDLSEG